MNCQTWIEKYVIDRDETAVQQIGQLLIKKELSLADFIVTIGDFLQSSELSKRSTALILIGRVLKLLPSSFLQANEIHHLIIFVSAKLSDNHILGQPAVDLFHILAKQTGINDEDCLLMIKSIFSDIYVQSFPQLSRYNIYVILLHFLLHRLDVVRQFGSDFVCNFIQSMDGERDPRNLVLCFQCLQCMVKHLDIEPYKEELFEVVACYFPMEYKPKANSTENEETITNEQLALSLRNVLTSTSKFAPYCIPMLIEKIESDIPTARLAAMDVFIHCVDEYEARDIKNFLTPMWSLLSKQALCAENQDIETSALQAITALMQLIGKSIQNDETEISTKKFVDRAIRECEKFLKELDLKLVWPATKVLQAIARANSTCASMIWSSVLPLLIKQFENLEQVNHKRTVLDMIAYFLQPTGIRTLIKLPNDVSEELWILVSTYFDTFPGHCLTLILLLLQLNTTPAQVLEDNLTKLILQEEINTDIRTKLSPVLKTLGSSVLFDRVCTNLLTNLINSWTIPKTTPSNDVLTSCIDLCHNSERCQERLERFFTPSQSFVRLLPNLFKYLSPFYVLNNLFTPLFDLLSTSIVSDPNAKSFCAKSGAIADESCANFVQNLYQIYLFNESAWESNETKTVLPVIYLVANLKRKIFQNELETIFNRIDENLMQRIFNGPSDERAETYCYFYANLINKLSSKTEIIERVQSILKQCETSLDEKHLKIWTILVKGLIVARSALVDQYIQTIVVWMKEKSAISDSASRSLTMLTQLDEQSFLLTSNADCLVHPMIKQILFMKILSQIKPLLNNNELTTNQMNVLVDLLGNVPKSIIQDEIVSLLPILIRGLTSSNESVWSSALNSICDLIQSNPDSVVDQLDTLLPRLMTLATYPEDMSTRITSLKCLKYLTELPIHKIQPYRRRLLHVLKKCLDDHKRLVRKQAVETNMSWCLLNA